MNENGARDRPVIVRAKGRFAPPASRETIGGRVPPRLRLDDLPDLLRVDEVADLLRLSPAAVRQRICRGQLAALKLGPAPRDPTERDRRAVRVPRSALLAFLGLPLDSSPTQSDGPRVARRHSGGE